MPLFKNLSTRHWFSLPRRQVGSLLENVIVGFVLTVVLTRLYLLVSPVTILLIGGVHVAHMLYGGLFMSVAGLLMLVFNNHQAARISSWLIGIGMGLFWDEVGKYISVDNDYYFRLAWPIIYVMFLGLSSIWIILSKRQKPTMTDRIQQVWLGFYEGLQSNISELDFNQLSQELGLIKKSKPTGFYKTTLEALEKLESELRPRVIKEKRWSYRHSKDWFKKIVSRVFLLRFARASLIGLVLLRLGWLVYLVLNIPLDRVFISGLAEALSLIWLLIAVWVMYRDRYKGIRLAKAILLFSIVFMGVFNFYSNQFEAVLIVSFDIILYLIISEIYQLQRK